MADAALNLPPALDAFVEDQVRSGAYRDREAVITDAVALLRDRTASGEDDAAKLARLNARLQAGIEQLDRGEGEEVTDLGAWFDAIEAEVEAGFTQTRR
ncbi:ribbon-helix-helix domain-containing protein [Brevundimonas sp. FT23042]|uniref:ribbon-helix-helix domain-containing protein n=1 Tax=Brevundimonas sp. FT23042 TaxID=3393749 RepID=UPI003B585C4B